ncbi:FRAS1-related extracellular matrix protein 2-like [Amphiura filiformis]|uniref:FRAS1-related extracellular matrix protein 2-like n=1 Tax=Amphiura filiformis TaxID=82378 RepID=UPI003B21680D
MPEDYPVIDEVLTIPAELTAASLTVVVFDDKMVEADVESFELILVKQPINSSDCDLGDPGMTHIMIEDDDCCWRVEEEELAINEGDGKVDIAVTCARVPTSNVVPKYPVIAALQIRATNVTGQRQATLSEDYTLSSATNNITVNSATSTTSTWSFTIKDDAIAEATEYLDVSLESAYGGDLCGPLTTRVAIHDNDASVRIASCGNNNTVQESGGTLGVILERIGDASGSASILFYTVAKSATPGSGPGVGDYDRKNLVVMFPAFQRKIVQDIEINNDLEQENNEKFEVFISESSQHTVVDATANSCEVTILDDDCTFFISIPETSRVVTEGAGVTVPITVTRQTDTDSTASIWVETSTLGTGRGFATPGEDYIPLSRMVTFLPGETSHSISLIINNDDRPEIIERLIVSLPRVDCSINGVNSVEINIQDDDDGLGIGAIFIIIGSLLAGLILIGGALLCLVIRRRARGLSIVTEPPTVPQTGLDQFPLVPLGYGGNAYGLPRNGFGYPSTEFGLPKDGLVGYNNGFGNGPVDNSNPYYGFGYP